MADLSDARYKLYSSPFSLYSMMARHTIHLGPTTANAKPPKEITLGFIDHKGGENLKEEYLRFVNPKGQVPAMTGNVLKETLTDSISITLYLAEKHYPAMLPAEHTDTIRDLLTRLHAIYGLSISNKNPTPEMTVRNPSPVEKILQRTDISPEYRKALEFKLQFHNEGNAVAFQPAIVAKARAEFKAVFDTVMEYRKQSGASLDDWTFGSKVGPTALDSHLMPFVLRCLEADSAELVPEELQIWARKKEQGPIWKKVMHGRRSVYDPSMGPVAEMKDMMVL